jgi:glycosyltransferase involved in cell wall biosynthesis
VSIAVDATYSSGSELSGVGVYCREMLFQLAHLHPEQAFTWCYRPHRFLSSFQQKLPKNCSRSLLQDRWPLPFRPNIFHGLNQRMPLRKLQRSVCTFHDLFVMTSEYSTAEFRARFTALAYAAVERADLIIAVSQFTADQVNELLGVEKARIRVVHHGVSAAPRRETRRMPWILNVGALQHRKNVLRLIEAFERSATEPWRLVLAGSSGYGAEEIVDAINRSPARDRIDQLGFVSPAKLTELYQSASIFVFPSLDEGFGIPVLEAMAHEVPVIASNRSALPEVCGGAALLIDPFCTDEIASAIKLLSTDQGARSRLIEKGIAWAASFTWQRAAQATWKVYKEFD